MMRPERHPPEADTVDCSVLVPVLNEERHLGASVAAMLRQRFDGNMELLLVDGGSSDRTPALLRELADADDRIHVLRNPLGTTPSGLNIALVLARGRWVARMDAHSEYPEDYLTRGVQRLQRGDTRWVSGPQIPHGNNAISRAVALALRTPLGRGASKKWGLADDPLRDEYELDSGVFDGVWERQTLLRYGGWDERWLRNQDSELAGRFLAEGERLVCIPEMGARYTPRGTFRSLWRQYIQYGEYRVRTAVRHPHTMRRSHLLPPGLVAVTIAGVAAPKPIRHLARGGLSAYGAALAFAGISAAREPGGARDAWLVPEALLVMHFAHGLGAFRGFGRYGLPAAAIARAFGLRALARRLLPAPQAVYAPSLLSGSPASHPPGRVS